MAADLVMGADSTNGFLPPDNTLASLDARTKAIVKLLVPAASPLQLLLIGDGSATLPVRPSTQLPVAFNTTTQPPLTGSQAGGTTGMVAGLDVWLGGVGTGASGTQLNVVTENPLGSGTYGNRPATTQTVIWKGVVAPNGGGTVNGGTPLMVNNLDEWHQWVVQ